MILRTLQVFSGLKRLIVKCFHRRTIIVLSNQRVVHLHIPGWAQALVCLGLLGQLCWASYEAGNMMAGKHSTQTAAISSDASAPNGAEQKFNAMLATTPMVTAENKSAPSPAAAVDKLLADPGIAVGMGNNQKLYERIASLEQRVAQLKDANQSLISTVRTASGGKIAALEKILQTTGLNADSMRRQAAVKTASSLREKGYGRRSGDGDEGEVDEHGDEAAPVDGAAAGATGGQGGPYIPVGDLTEYYQSQEQQIAVEVSRLKELTQLVEALPLASPITNAEMKSPFGRRVDPFTGRVAFHAGLDLAGADGSKIASTGEGIVTFAGRSGAYGKVVDIDHGYGITTRYGHMREILVEVGQKVKTGSVLGIQGTTGRSTGPHVHYEVRFNDKVLNPRNFLQAGQYALQKE